MATLIKPTMMDSVDEPLFNDKSATLQQAEEAAIKWTSELITANYLLSIEKKSQLAAESKALKTENELKALRAENPETTLKNQEKSLQMALTLLAKTKSKTILGTVEMVAMSASLCALTMTAVGLLDSSLFSTFISSKIEAISLISGVVASSGLLGWNLDRKATLITRMAQDNVNACQRDVNKSKIRCQDYDNNLKQKLAETNTAQEELKKANLRVHSATQTVHEIELRLNKANKEIAACKNKFTDYNHYHFQPAPEKPNDINMAESHSRHFERERSNPGF